MSIVKIDTRKQFHWLELKHFIMNLTKNTTKTNFLLTFHYKVKISSLQIV